MKYILLLLVFIHNVEFSTFEKITVRKEIRTSDPRGDLGPLGHHTSDTKGLMLIILCSFIIIFMNITNTVFDFIAKNITNGYRFLLQNIL